MITGLHTIFYSDDSDGTRTFFRNVLGWLSLDAGDGWLIFKTPPSELGIHPTSSDAGERWATVPFHQASLMCDDIDATVAELRRKGVAVKDDIEDQGFGLVTSLAPGSARRACALQVPGAGWLMLYQPRHALAHQLDGCRWSSRTRKDPHGITDERTTPLSKHHDHHAGTPRRVPQGNQGCRPLRRCERSQLMADVFIDEDNLTATSFQLSSDSESVLERWKLSDPYIAEVMRPCTVSSFEVFGSPSAAVADGLGGTSDLDARITPRLIGYLHAGS